MSSTNINGYIIPKRDTTISNLPLLSTSSLYALSTVTFTAALSQTATVSQVVSGLINGAAAGGGQPDAGRALYTPTADEIVDGITSCKVGDTFTTVFSNACGQTVTITGGVNVTIVGTAAVPTAKIASILFIVTSTTAAARAVKCFVTLSA